MEAMNINPDLQEISANTSGDQSLVSVLQENTLLMGVHVLGTLLLVFVWWPLGLFYLGYCAFSIIFYMAVICPYCYHYTVCTCPAGYHYISTKFFKPQEGKTFQGQFRRTIVVMYPGWFLPPLAGLYLLITDFSWSIVVLLLLFCLVGFWILPKVSRQTCERCENAEECPRGKSIN